MKSLLYNLVLVLLAFLLISASFFLVYKLNFESKTLIPQLPKKDLSNVISYPSGSLQFYPNMRFNDNKISFKVDDNCDIKKKEKIALAFDRIENETSGLITFEKTDFNEDIMISCNETEIEKIPSSEYFVAGEGGAESIVNTSLFYVIEKGKVLLYYKNEKKCIGYNVELHELLHAFGFKHSQNEYSIMYPTTECFQALTKDIISELKRLYSIEPLADIYISNVSAFKHGMYLDFEIEIKNQGILPSKEVNLILSSGGKTIDEFEIGDIDYGEGKTLSAENVRLPLVLSTDAITFVLTSPNKEISAENNRLTLVIS